MRRASRPEILVPQRVAFTADGGEPSAGWIVRISIVGADIETVNPPPVGSRVDVFARFEESGPELRLPARVQWATMGQFGALFGSLGVRETHAIIEAARSGGIGQGRERPPIPTAAPCPLDVSHGLLTACARGRSAR